jgi:quercetin dioxygenase-like cupin family protein
MRTAAIALAAAAAASPALAQQSGFAKPTMVLQETVTGLPTAAKQEVRVMTAVFQPGDRTVTHTHPFPVTVYVLEGTFTLELEGRAPVVLKAGEAMVEPPHVKMTGFNRSTTEPLRALIFYVSDVGAPFLHPSH